MLQPLGPHMMGAVWEWEGIDCTSWVIGEERVEQLGSVAQSPASGCVGQRPAP